MSPFPGPRSSLAMLWAYVRDPLTCMVPLAETWGDTFTIPGNPPIVLTGHPEGIRAIYAARPETLTPANTDLGVFIGDTSLILVGGERHKRLRRLLMPPFHGARMRAYGRLIQSLVREHTRSWTPGRTVSVHQTATDLSLDVILQAVFGVRDPERMARLARLLTDVVHGITPAIAMFPALRRELGGFGPYAAFRRRQVALHEALDALIAEARGMEPGDDILSLLVHAQAEDGRPLTDEELRDQLLLLVVAGHETTAIAVAWALHALGLPENAGVAERLRAELDALGPDPDPAVVDEHPWLRAVCDETLRRYPGAPAPAPRRLLAPLELMGRTVPEGTAVAAAIGLVHFREELYPEPMAFRPERFLERKFSPFEFIPFGGGARRCLGAALAGYEMRLVVAELVRRFRTTPARPGPDPGKVRAANVGPRYGVPVVVDEVRSSDRPGSPAS
ncbi:MAG: cytochrome P450 [Alphaproteobacteria bacterium]|nr:cytochrome P450 [Alphaproteobacteria bacterium]MCB9695331.1 cytochrome P450 [Alphaproteobacteria bacterium]